MTADRPLPSAVFLSGSGRTLDNLLKQQAEGTIPIEIKLVISSSAQVKGVEIARAAGIETLVVNKPANRTPHSDGDSAYMEAMFGPCRQLGVKLVIMAGFLKHVLIPADFAGRVINIHPSLIPAFCGAGMYGMRVHAAAIERGVQFSGCTVHYVDNDYDHGPIILQKICAVPKGFTAEQLAAAVFELECQALPEAINQVAYHL